MLTFLCRLYEARLVRSNGPLGLWCLEHF